MGAVWAAIFITRPFPDTNTMSSAVGVLLYLCLYRHRGMYRFVTLLVTLAGVK